MCRIFTHQILEILTQFPFFVPLPLTTAVAGVLGRGGGDLLGWWVVLFHL